MLKYIIYLIGIYLIAREAGWSQTNDIGTIGYSDEVAYGIPFSISMANSVIASNASFVVEVSVHNGSTNSIRLIQVNGSIKLTLSLKDSVGNVKMLIDEPKTYSNRMSFDLKPGKSYSLLLELALGSDVKLGNYVLQAKTYCVSDNCNVGRRRFWMLSNQLVLQVK